MDKFGYEENGYNKEEVNDFVNQVYEKTKGVIDELQSLRAENAALKKKLSVYEGLEGSLNQTLIHAESTAVKLREAAQEEAMNIIKDAKSNANRIVNDALIRAEKIENEADTLERNIRIFKKKVKLTIEQQLAVIDELEDIELE